MLLLLSIDTSCDLLCSCFLLYCCPMAARAVGVVGEICSAATVAAAGVATSRQVPLISPAATSPALSDFRDMFFRTVPSDKFQGHAAANLLIKKGYRNVAVVYEDAAYGYGLAFNFIASFTKGGADCGAGPQAGLVCRTVGAGHQQQEKNLGPAHAHWRPSSAVRTASLQAGAGAWLQVEADSVCIRRNCGCVLCRGRQCACGCDVQQGQGETQAGRSGGEGSH